jgi:hypothetical protein
MGSMRVARQAGIQQADAYATVDEASGRHP